MGQCNNGTHSQSVLQMLRMHKGRKGWRRTSPSCSAAALRVAGVDPVCAGECATVTCKRRVRISECAPLQNRECVHKPPNEESVENMEIMNHLSRVAVAAAQIEIRSTWCHPLGGGTSPRSRAVFAVRKFPDPHAGL